LCRLKPSGYRKDPSFPGILLLARPVGLLDLTDKEHPDQKVLAVAHRRPRFDQIQSIDHVFAHSLREIEKFFSIYKELEGKDGEVRGWHGPEDVQKPIGRMPRTIPSVTLRMDRP
jgi:inorganic pyrophosphatase